jgi:uncharacterized protein (DUF433 family)
MALPQALQYMMVSLLLLRIRRLPGGCSVQPFLSRNYFLVTPLSPNATLDWSKCPAVESVPGKQSGAWVFRNTRMPVSAVFENLEAGSSTEEVIEQFHVTREQIQFVLEFAARSLDSPLDSCRPACRE